MSLANKCDLCGTLFESKRGAVTIAKIYKDGEGDECLAWEEIDFCTMCGARLMAVIGPALRDRRT